MDNLMAKYYPSYHFLTEEHTAAIVRKCQVSSNGEIQILARRLAETHDDLQATLLKLDQCQRQRELDASMEAKNLEECSARLIAQRDEALASRDAYKEQHQQMVSHANALQTRLDTLQKEADSAKTRMWEIGHDNERLTLRLEELRRHIIIGLDGAWLCRICKGMWANSRDGELHEDWCPYAPAAVEINGPTE